MQIEKNTYYQPEITTKADGTELTPTYFHTFKRCNHEWIVDDVVRLTGEKGKYRCCVECLRFISQESWLMNRMADEIQKVKGEFREDITTYRVNNTAGGILYKVDNKGYPTVADGDLPALELMAGQLSLKDANKVGMGLEDRAKELWQKLQDCLAVYELYEDEYEEFGEKPKKPIWSLVANNKKY